MYHHIVGLIISKIRLPMLLDFICSSGWYWQRKIISKRRNKKTSDGSKNGTFLH
jgi:hypothetical protein